MTFIPFIRNGRQGRRFRDRRSSGIGGWIVISVLLLLLVGAAVIGYLGWTISNADVPTSGYVAMALGVIFSLAFGVGLMALVFYSSRKGFDEPPVLIQASVEANSGKAPIEPEQNEADPRL